jgi:hypothetical protein
MGRKGGAALARQGTRLAERERFHGCGGVRGGARDVRVVNRERRRFLPGRRRRAALGDDVPAVSACGNVRCWGEPDMTGWYE